MSKPPRPSGQELLDFLAAHPVHPTVVAAEKWGVTTRTIRTWRAEAEREMGVPPPAEAEAEPESMPDPAPLPPLDPPGNDAAEPAEIRAEDPPATGETVPLLPPEPDLSGLTYYTPKPAPVVRAYAVQRKRERNRPVQDPWWCDITHRINWWVVGPALIAAFLIWFAYWR